MRIVSWNVNGFRSILKKGFGEQLNNMQADIFCVQETKASYEVMENLLGSSDIPYEVKSFHSAERKGYSGVAIFSKKVPKEIFVAAELEACLSPSEGRVLVHDYENFYVVTIYVPNSGENLRRLELRYRVWDPNCALFLRRLAEQKPVIACGDFNVAHREIDLARPDQNHESAGFTDQEREGFARILGEGFLDTFRVLYPEKREAYTWWSMRTAARRRNIGWRIDYCLMSESCRLFLRNAFILANIMGSDHAPIGVDLELS
ncbi:MAG: exodeoxyribonuclease III [Puniceicoccales bacterium]|jgi:exodeoxyribonuclease-3|nr:exodeoxyribonuclease III [Puniceicoccales bacterium]